MLELEFVPARLSTDDYLIRIFCTCLNHTKVTSSKPGSLSFEEMEWFKSESS
jgi:hypothetical protein